MKSYNLLTSPVGATLFFKSLPMFLGIFASIAYNLVDTFFVARLGVDELAAMSFSFPVVMICINLIMGLSSGVTSVVSRAIGENKPDEAKNLASKGLELTILFSLALTIFGLLSQNFLFTLLGVDGTLMGHTKEYMTTWYLGVIFMNLSIIASAIFRAKGNVLYPSFMLIFGAVLNAILDPILIFGWGFIPKMGVQGAALTTVIGYAVSTILMFYKLYKEENIKIPLPRSIDIKLWKTILIIAIPTALANSLTPFSTAFTNKLLVAYGHAAVAANSIATRLETIPFIAIFALGSVLAPFMGQNFGAKNDTRLREGIKKSFLFSYVLGIVFAVLFIFQHHNIVALFDPSPEVMKITSSYFAFIPLTYGILGTVFLTMHSMNAVGRPFIGNMLSLLRLIVLYLPLAYFLNIRYGVEGIFLSRVVANLTVGLLSTALVYKSFFFKQKQIAT